MQGGEEVAREVSSRSASRSRSRPSPGVVRGCNHEASPSILVRLALGGDSGCISLTSNDPAAAVADLAVSGAGVAGTSSGTQPHASSGGCGSTVPANWNPEVGELLIM